jgi:hypothetical protein
MEREKKGRRNRDREGEGMERREGGEKEEAGSSSDTVVPCSSFHLLFPSPSSPSHRSDPGHPGHAKITDL